MGVPSDEVGGDGGTDFVFGLVGDPLSLLPPAASPPFDPDASPLRPIAVSDHGIMIAHPEGFVLANPKELINATKQAREKGTVSRCVRDISVVDVALSGVSILCLSHDQSVLAAYTDSQIHFFSLSSLHTKDVKPFAKCSLAKLGRVNDFRWLHHLPASYIVLSDGGVLSHGKAGKEPKILTASGAEAVDASKEGHIAVVRNKQVTIISSKFEEILHIPLSTDGNDCKDIKVDCLGWVRDDSIVIGWKGFSEGNGEYMVQVIRSEKTTFVKGPSKVWFCTYHDFFNGIIDNPRVGRTLRFGYLCNWGLMLASNTKSFNGQIDALRWGPAIDVKTSSFLMLEDNCIGDIDVQENDKNSVILGFGVGNLSLLQNTTVRVGLEQMEVAPEHILLYLTGDGKLAIYCLARTSDMFFTAENVMRKELSSFVTSVKCQIIATEHNVDSTNTETVIPKPKLSFKLAPNAAKKQLLPPTGHLSVKEEPLDLQFHCDDTDLKPLKLCFDEEETILHDLLFCQADKSHWISLSAHLDGFGGLVYLELTPGAVDHESLYTKDGCKETLRELYILLKCLHKRRYSLGGKFGIGNFVVSEARMRITIKLANVKKGMLLKDSCDGPRLDLEGFVMMVRRDIFKNMCIPHDLNLWLSDIFEEDIEDLMPYHSSLMGLVESGDSLSVWYDKFLDLKVQNKAAYTTVCTNLKKYDNWQEELEGKDPNFYLHSTFLLGFYKKKLRDLLRLLRNSRQHRARIVHEKFALIVRQHYPNLIIDLQKELFLAGAFIGKYRALKWWDLLDGCSSSR